MQIGTFILLDYNYCSITVFIPLDGAGGDGVANLNNLIYL